MSLLAGRTVQRYPSINNPTVIPPNGLCACETGTHHRRHGLHPAGMDAADQQGTQDKSRDQDAPQTGRGWARAELKMTSLTISEQPGRVHRKAGSLCWLASLPSPCATNHPSFWSPRRFPSRTRARACPHPFMPLAPGRVTPPSKQSPPSSPFPRLRITQPAGCHPSPAPRLGSHTLLKGDKAYSQAHWPEPRGASRDDTLRALFAIGMVIGQAPSARHRRETTNMQERNKSDHVTPHTAL